MRQCLKMRNFSNNMNDEQMIWQVYENKQKTKSCENFGLFGRIVDKIDKENDILTEALITSYPYSNVLSMLHRKYKAITTHIQADPIKSSKGNSATRGISFYINKKDYDQEFKNKLSQELFVYGYFISFVESLVNEMGIFIEPKYPFVVDHKYLKDKRFFHATNVKNLDKIKSIGLTPKDSQTSFSHEGNRIYIMASDTVDIMNNLKNTLARNKKQSSEDMVILEINAKDLTLYIDPNFDDTLEYTSLFTFQNIPPKLITVIG